MLEARVHDRNAVCLDFPLLYLFGNPLVQNLPYFNYNTVTVKSNNELYLKYCKKLLSFKKTNNDNNFNFTVNAL